MLTLALLAGAALAADWKDSLNGYCAQLFDRYEDVNSMTDANIKAFKASREIPILAVEHQDLNLVHVQSVIRHGARAPAADRAAAVNMENTIQWDCPFGETYVPENVDNLVFDKRFDADPVSNILRGTCEVGQLLEEGANQEYKLGEIVFDAYFGDENVLGSAEKKLADISASTATDFSDIFFVRSTDKSRTRLSGSHFMSAVMGPTSTSGKTLPVHIVDYNRETLFPNEKGFCPEIEDAAHKAENSSELAKLVIDNNITRREIYEGFGSEPDSIWPVGVLDMLKCHICGHKEGQLPEGIRPVDAKRQDLVKRALKVVDDEEIFRFHYNNNEYSRVSMIRPITDMKAFFLGAYSDGTESNSILEGYLPEYSSRISQLRTLNNGSFPKFLLYSAHDTTVMPILAALDIWNANGLPRIYSPYASMLNFEYYEKAGEYFVRIVYNGEVITPRLEGCKDQDVCPIEKLFTASDFATPETYKSSCKPRVTPDGSRALAAGALGVAVALLAL
ncbi:MAG: uncharacterized protein KVP18_004415 [Porospora cf. gigantea A]|uniref:uncharacterized protein n=1 Tax=Porospora cf. gigantea A TaxID=2853593 RepID=UPI003559642D|nr:MAG: hypothetical protein KVP18_004415 [Porospora cf. gigantea A]